MERFSRLTGILASLPQDNIDTDIIFPARFLLITDKAGLGHYAFYEWRYDADGAPNPDFVLNREPWSAARIIVAGDNFGCGSSREQAPWALKDLGIRCVISTSFGEIFRANCLKNGILPVSVSQHHRSELQDIAAQGLPVTVDLEAQSVRWSAAAIRFEIGAWQRDALLNGWDEIAIINQSSADIAAFEQRQRKTAPWLYDGEA